MSGDAELLSFVRLVACGSEADALRRLAAAPGLALLRVEVGATRAAAQEYFLAEIGHHLYAGESALHVAAAAYRVELARRLLAAGADVRARNRRGAEPLHHAADGQPGSTWWNPRAQATAIAVLLGAGAEPNARDASGVAPLHRAVRTRCAAAVQALLEGGADSRLTTSSGSTALDLATRATGRGGSGSAAARAEQQAILRLRERART